MVVVKGCPQELPKSPQPPAQGAWVSESIDLRCFTGLSILAIVTGTNPSGRLSVDVAPEPSGPWAPVARFLLQGTATVEVPTGPSFARLRLDAVSGTFGAQEGFRFWVTPHAGPLLTGPLPLKVVAVNASTLGDTVVVPAVPGRRIKVCAYTVIAAGDVSLTWKSGTTPLSGPLPLAANVGAAPTVPPPAFVLATAPGEALVISLSGMAATTVAGHVSYWDTDEV